MLSLVIPTIDEGENLKKLIPLVKDLCDEIVIVDDSSADDTVAVANEFGCHVIQRRKHLGYGTAVFEGVDASRHDIVAIMDADMSHPYQMLKAKSLIEDDLVDIIRFSRFLPGGGMEIKWRYAGYRLYNLIMSLILGVRIKDITGGFTIAKKACFDYNKTTNLEWSLEFIRVNRNKRIAEIPYFYSQRYSGKSKSGDMRRIVKYLIAALKLRITI